MRFNIWLFFLLLSLLTIPWSNAEEQVQIAENSQISNNSTIPHVPIEEDSLMEQVATTVSPETLENEQINAEIAQAKEAEAFWSDTRPKDKLACTITVCILCGIANVLAFVAVTLIWLRYVRDAAVP